MCSENKGTDQLCSYCTADLCLCFHVGKNLVFPWCGSLEQNERGEFWSHNGCIV